jgi:hypothetical protein
LLALFLGTASLAFSQYTKSSLKAENFLETREDLTDLQNWLVSNIACPASLGNPGATPAACTSGDYVPLVNSNGATLIASPSAGAQASDDDFSQVGDYYLRARCVPCTDLDATCGGTGFRLSVEVKKMSGGSSLLSKAHGWQELFDANFARENGIPCPLD